MIKIISLILLLGTSPVLAQIAAIQGHSFLGGTQAVTSGLKSSNYMQGIVPYATICVYNTGTTVPATIYANASGAPLSSCFTSNASISTDPGGWIFWAAINQGLDVVMSGGVSPNMYPAPVTISDLYPSTQIISGCGFGTVCLISQGGTGATTAAGALANLGGAPLTGTGTSGTWPISTTGNAATASIATNIAGGTEYEILVQTGANTTGFVTGGTGLLYQSSAGNMPIITSSPYVTANPNPYDASSQAANDLYVQNAVNLTMATSPFTITGGTISFNSLGSGSTLNYSVTSGAITTINSWIATGANYLVGDVITPQAGNYDAMIRVTAVNGSNQPTAGTILYGGTGYSAGTAVAGTAANTIEFTFLLSGTLTSNATLIMAHGTYRTQSNQWIFANNTTGAYTVTVCVGGATDACAAGGRTVVVPQGTNNNREEFLQTDGELNVDLAGVIDARDLLNGVTGTGNIVLANSPTLVTPVLGAATAASINGTTIPASSTLVTTTTLDNATLPVSATSGTFSGNVTAGATTPTTIGSSGVLLNGVPALQAQASLNNYYSGGAGNMTGTGYNNTANGYAALAFNTTGNSNTANGLQALFSNTTGGANTANGLQALFSNTTGNNNTANGYAALYANTTGIDNTANGFQALSANTTGYSNTANGYVALYTNTTGYNNTANGYAALYTNTTGYNNTANGLQALYYNTTGSSNTANGYTALYSNTTGYNNTANGYTALYSNTTGYNNTANGYQAGQYIADGVTANQTSSNSVYEGYKAYPLADGDTNENVIGNTAIGHGSNTTTLGNSSITDTYLAGIVHGTSFTGNAATATTAAALSVPLAHAIVFPDPNAGAVYTASQVLGTFFSPMAGTVPAGGAGTFNAVAATSVCNLGTAATASTTFTFADNGSSFGTVAFAASGTTGTFTISSAKSVSSGDKITLTAPATADATAAGLNCSLVFAY